MNDNILKELNKSIDNKEIMHSYIFEGIDGIGKKDVAFEFAKNIMCDDNISIHKFETNNHPDFTYIEPDEKNTIKIEIIRNLIKDINIKPIESKYKVYIIDEADLITTQGQNALLKTLEEPPAYAIIILITSNYYGLIDTIRSRSQKISFLKLSDEEILKYIKNSNINIKIDTDLLLYLINGRLKYINIISNDCEIINQLYELIKNIDNLDLIELYNKENIFIDNKEKIFNILDYMIKIYGYILKNNVIKIKNVNKSIEIIEQCKRNINGNINFEIAIDNLLQGLWEVYNA